MIFLYETRMHGRVTCPFRTGRKMNFLAKETALVHPPETLTSLDQR